MPGAADAISELVRRARGAGVQHLVLLSGRGEQEAQACEAIIQGSGIDWTIVRASWFNQNFSEGAFVDLVQSGQIILPDVSTPEPYIDVDDIAEVVVVALTQPGHAGEKDQAQQDAKEGELGEDVGGDKGKQGDGQR